MQDHKIKVFYYRFGEKDIRMQLTELYVDGKSTC